MNNIVLLDNRDKIELQNNIKEEVSNTASAISKTVSGKYLTLTDVSPLAHKCSCRLVNNDVYKFDSSNILNLPTTPDEFANINCEIKADSTIVWDFSRPFLNTSL